MPVSLSPPMAAAIKLKSVAISACYPRFVNISFPDKSRRGGRVISLTSGGLFRPGDREVPAGLNRTTLQFNSSRTALIRRYNSISELRLTFSHHRSEPRSRDHLS